MSDSHEHGGVGHTLPIQQIGGVLLILLFLTGLTVLTGRMDLHGYDLTVAMIIATVKASLVCAVFMHMLWDRPFLRLGLVIAVIMVGAFLAYTLIDTAEYQDQMRAWQLHEEYQKSTTG